MTKRLVGLVALVMVLMAAQAASAMGGKHGKGDPQKPISNSGWPTGVKELANRADRIGGYWINANDWFHYAGDAKAFNEFLAQYAKVQGTPLTLVLGDTRGQFSTTGLAASTGYDWQLSVIVWGRATKATELRTVGWDPNQIGVTVTLPLGGRIALKDIQVPANINVVVIGEQTREVAEFLAEHKAKQDKAKGAAQPAK